MLKCQYFCDVEKCLKLGGNINCNVVLFHPYPGHCHSELRSPSVECIQWHLSLAVLDHVGPRCLLKLSRHLVFGRPGFLVHSLGVHSVTRIVHLLSVNHTTCPAHRCLGFLMKSMISRTFVWSLIQSLRLWSWRVILNIILSNVDIMLKYQHRFFNVYQHWFFNIFILKQPILKTGSRVSS